MRLLDLVYGMGYLVFFYVLLIGSIRLLDIVVRFFIEPRIKDFKRGIKL